MGLVKSYGLEGWGRIDQSGLESELQASLKYRVRPSQKHMNKQINEDKKKCWKLILDYFAAWLICVCLSQYWGLNSGACTCLANIQPLNSILNNTLAFERELICEPRNFSQLFLTASKNPTELNTEGRNLQLFVCVSFRCIKMGLCGGQVWFWWGFPCPSLNPLCVPACVQSPG